MTSVTPAYHAPTDIADAARLLTSYPATLIIGGGTVVLPRLTYGYLHPDHLIDITALSLDRITAERDGSVRIGAAVTYNQVLAAASPRQDLLRIVASGITGGPQIRNQGTLGGSACYGNPASDVPAALVALDARLTLFGEDGARTVRAADSFLAPFQTAAEPTEILREIEIPDTAAADTYGYVKIKRSESSWPLAVCAARLRHLAHCTIVLGGTTPTPVTLETAIDGDGPELTRRQATSIRHLVAETVTEWWSDELGDADYRRRIAGVAATRAIGQALRRARSRDSDQ